MGKGIAVMVTGVGGGGFGEQIIKALRLSDLNYEIIGGDMSPYSKGLTAVDQPYILPPATDPNYLHSVLGVCRKHKVRALFAGSEPELKQMSNERDLIQKEGLFLPINPKSVIEVCLDKSKTTSFLTDNGFFAPKTITIRSAVDIKLVDFYPAVLKPSLGAGGSANIMLAQSEAELCAFAEHLLSIYPEFIVQEYIGTPESEFTVGVLHSMDGQFINSIALKRAILSALSNRLKIPNRSGNEKLGKILAISSGVSQGEIGKFPEVTVPCEEIARKLGALGAINIQCRYIDEKVYVFEINPRFSGTTSLRAMAGFNEPDILIRTHVLGHAVDPDFSFRHGHIMRGLQDTLIPEHQIPIAKDLL